MKRFLVVAVLCSLLSPVLEAQRRRPTGPTQPPPNTTPPAAQFGQPLPGLPQFLLTFFNDGREEFREPEDVDDGLGPVFNGRACGECHNVPALGGGSERLVTRFGTTTDGAFDPLARLGGSLVQNRAIGPQDGSPHRFRPEGVPREATVVSRRRSTPLFGLGLVDATPDATFIALAAQQAARRDGTAGRVAMVDNLAAGMQTVGKFGWKAQVPTLFQFSGDAYLNEMGITSPFFPNENCPQGDCNELQFNPRPGLNDGGEDVDALANFMAMLAPPPRGPITADVTAGEAVFNRIGCNSCHVSTLQTGQHDNPALNRVTYNPYSDFLLHDMGSLGDGIVQGTATGRELRTAPLWGLRMMTTLLHDGRVRTIEGAIGAHDGQGRASRDAFNGLNANDRARLLAFLRSL
jgi:CxxC motif-containing protein (DUF1111 family)